MTTGKTLLLAGYDEYYKNKTGNSGLLKGEYICKLSALK